MLDNLIESKIKELPENIQYAIHTFDWAHEIETIAKENQLQIDELEIFYRETLLVMVGLTDAEDFEKNLEMHMHIDAKKAEHLVDEANDSIFIPLRKIAFSPQIENIEEKEIPDQYEIHTIMEEEGIKLINEKETREHPKNELQELANSLFSDKKSSKSILNKKFSIENISKRIIKQEDSLLTNKNKTTSYNEEIKEKDLLGISAHRINTDILNNQNISVNNSNKDTKTQNLDINKLINKHISKTEFIDVSPTKEEQISERGDFLKHIGAL